MGHTKQFGCISSIIHKVKNSTCVNFNSFTLIKRIFLSYFQSCFLSAWFLFKESRKMFFDFFHRRKLFAIWIILKRRYIHKPVGVRSGEYGGCWKISLLYSFSFCSVSWVTYRLTLLGERWCIFGWPNLNILLGLQCSVEWIDRNNFPKLLFGKAKRPNMGAFEKKNTSGKAQELSKFDMKTACTLMI